MRSTLCMLELSLWGSQNGVLKLVSYPAWLVFHGGSLHWAILEGFVDDMLILLQVECFLPFKYVINTYYNLIY